MYRLSQKCRLIEYIDLNKGLHKVNDGPLCYFDPNLAPLYGDGSCEGISNELMTLDVPLGRTVSRSTIKI